MSTAFPRTTVQITEVRGLEKKGVTKGSLWQKGNLLFRNRDDGQQVRLQISTWAQAIDNGGRTYLLYETGDPSSFGLVIQPSDSCYCFEVFPIEEPGC
jgi:hypothetical protein